MTTPLSKFSQSEIGIESFEPQLESPFEPNDSKALAPVPKKRNPKKMDVDYSTQEVMDKLDSYQKARNLSDEARQNIETPESKMGKLEADSSPVSKEAVRIIQSLSPEQQAIWIGAFYPEYNVAKQEELKRQINLSPNEQDQCLNEIIDALAEKPEFAGITKTSFFELLQQEATHSPSAKEALRLTSTMTPEQQSEWISAFYPEHDILKQDQLKSQILIQDPEEKEACMNDILGILEEKPENIKLIEELENSADISEAEADSIIEQGVERAPAPVVAKQKITITKEAWLKIAKEAKWI